MFSNFYTKRQFDCNILEKFDCNILEKYQEKIKSVLQQKIVAIKDLHQNVLSKNVFSL